MHTRVQVASIGVALVILLGVFELVRRRKLGERYALLWMGAAVALLVLAVWQHLLYTLARAVGIYYPPNAFFVIAFGFAILLLLHFSIATSRLADETRMLAQKLALLEARLLASEARTGESGARVEGAPDDSRVQGAEHAGAGGGWAGSDHALGRDHVVSR
jgi:hypothetical protein